MHANVARSGMRLQVAPAGCSLAVGEVHASPFWCPAAARHPVRIHTQQPRSVCVCVCAVLAARPQSPPSPFRPLGAFRPAPFRSGAGVWAPCEPRPRPRAGRSRAAPDTWTAAAPAPAAERRPVRTFRSEDTHTNSSAKSTTHDSSRSIIVTSINRAKAAGRGRTTNANNIGAVRRSQGRRRRRSPCSCCSHSRSSCAACTGTTTTWTTCTTAP